MVSSVLFWFETFILRFSGILGLLWGSTIALVSCIECVGESAIPRAWWDVRGEARPRLTGLALVWELF
jgi:hypothetical protein